jgi:CRISPR type III-B/RAMP module-associated protein Cmr3
LFRTIEPMMFRGASEFSPASRGPQTGAWSRPLPPPSTITGALATLILQCENRPPPRGDPSAWYEEVIGIFGGKGSTALRGPYLINGEGIIYVQYKDEVLGLDELVKSLSKGEFLEASKELNKATKKFELGHVHTVGIRLSDARKAVGKNERGLLYSMTMIDYGKIGEQKNVGCSIITEVLKASDPLEKALGTPKIIRLGGEERLVGVMAKELQPVAEFVRTASRGAKKLRLYVASPMLFEASPTLISKEFETLGSTVFVRPSLREKVKDYLNEIGVEAASIKIAGSLGVLGGFSIAKPVRKPVYVALHPGSVIEVSRDSPYDQEERYKVYSNGLGLFRDLGYGTVIPIPVADHA